MPFSLRVRIFPKTVERRKNWVREKGIWGVSRIAASNRKKKLAGNLRQLPQIDSKRLAVMILEYTL
jgi:hypothetical protein